MIQIPVLFSLFPQTASATLLGTNKLAGIWGTSAAAWNYARSSYLSMIIAMPSAIAAFCGSFAGALLVTHVSGDFIRKLLPFILALIVIYTYAKKDLGIEHRPACSGWRQQSAAVLAGILIGFYDGFFGPGTGSFLVFAYIKLLGFDFLRASAAAKVVNVACNFAALLWFGSSGHLLWQPGLMMAVFNVAGSLCGARLALRHGSGLVRKLFLLVTSLLILKTGHDVFFV